ncbi:14261_t:CDS:2 [Acaulospora morrowiae]|uniref:14261_t:CDS:1 n=1 Tax=Acaulospora morrowiae TaxID=94023 RepID=A0A9N8VLY7_9GLOM|nr:14261_t:CDS:2 [Acaulospora morrowiae]
MNSPKRCSFRYEIEKYSRSYTTASTTLSQSPQWTNISQPDIVVSLENMFPAGVIAAGAEEPVLKVTVGGNTLLECLNVSYRHTDSTKAKALLKSPTIGIKYVYTVDNQNGMISHEARKFQLKFKTVDDFESCARIIGRYISCKSIPGNESVATSEMITQVMSSQGNGLDSNNGESNNDIMQRSHQNNSLQQYNKLPSVSSEEFHETRPQNGNPQLEKSQAVLIQQNNFTKVLSNQTNNLIDSDCINSNLNSNVNVDASQSRLESQNIPKTRISTYSADATGSEFRSYHDDYSPSTRVNNKGNSMNERNIISSPQHENTLERYKELSHPAPKSVTLQPHLPQRQQIEFDARDQAQQKESMSTFQVPLTNNRGSPNTPSQIPLQTPPINSQRYPNTPSQPSFQGSSLSDSFSEKSPHQSFTENSFISPQVSRESYVNNMSQTRLPLHSMDSNTLQINQKVHSDSTQKTHPYNLQGTILSNKNLLVASGKENSRDSYVQYTHTDVNQNHQSLPHHQNNQILRSRAGTSESTYNPNISIQNQNSQIASRTANIIHTNIRKDDRISDGTSLSIKQELLDHITFVDFPDARQIDLTLDDEKFDFDLQLQCPERQESRHQQNTISLQSPAYSNNGSSSLTPSHHLQPLPSLRSQSFQALDRVNAPRATNLSPKNKFAPSDSPQNSMRIKPSFNNASRLNKSLLLPNDDDELQEWIFNVLEDPEFSQFVTKVEKLWKARFLNDA